VELKRGSIKKGTEVSSCGREITHGKAIRSGGEKEKEGGETYESDVGPKGRRIVEDKREKIFWGAK